MQFVCNNAGQLHIVLTSKYVTIIDPINTGTAFKSSQARYGSCISFPFSPSTTARIGNNNGQSQGQGEISELSLSLNALTLLQALVLEIREDLNEHVHKAGDQGCDDPYGNEQDPAHKVLLDQRVLLIDDLLLP